VGASWWDWTAREFWFNTTPPVTPAAGESIYVDAGLSIVTASGTFFTAGMVNRIILIAGGKVPYEITAFSANNSVGIAVGYEGTANQADVAFRIIQDSFTIDSRVRGIRKPIVESGTYRQNLTYVPPREWDRRIPLSINESRPRHYTIVRWTSDGVPRIRLWPIPDTRYVVRFTAYCWLPELAANGDVVEMPGPTHRVLEDMAYGRLLSEVIHEEGPAVQMANARAAAGLAQLVKDNVTRPDWDAVRGIPPFGEFFGQPVVFMPPEFSPTVGGLY